MSGGFLLLRTLGQTFPESLSCRPCEGQLHFGNQMCVSVETARRTVSRRQAIRRDRGGNRDRVGKPNLARKSASQTQPWLEVDSRRARPMRRDNRETTSPTSTEHSGSREQNPVDTAPDSMWEPAGQELDRYRRGPLLIILNPEPASGPKVESHLSAK